MRVFLLGIFILAGCAPGGGTSAPPPAAPSEVVDYYGGGVAIVRPKAGGSCFCQAQTNFDESILLTSCSFFSEPATKAACKGYETVIYDKTKYFEKDPADEAD